MKQVIFLVALFINFALFCEPLLFRFKYNAGDKYTILSTVDEDVYVNSRLDHSAKIINRVSVNVKDIFPDGSALHDATFMTSEQSVGALTQNVWSWGETYDSSFTRDDRGNYTISDEYFMPTVRDVPIFPNESVEVGQKWNAQGHEAHDMRQTFGITKPFKVPFTATYEYLGQSSQESREGALLQEIAVTYNLSFDCPPVQHGVNAFSDYPVKTRGFSDQKIFWDSDKGAIDHYNETFRITIITAQGNVYDFVGKAQAQVTAFQSTKEDVTRIEKIVNDLGLENVAVSANDEGLTISIEKINFLADSSILQESEKEKLRKLAVILQNYPNNDILVTGHTALAGTKDIQEELSKQRAASVADFLLQLGIKDKEHIFTRGLGASVPIAPNTTEENKAKNRRVEITILDK